MSAMPADIMRATNSSGSIDSEPLLIVSTNDAAEYCAARDDTLLLATGGGSAVEPFNMPRLQNHDAHDLAHRTS
jgi:hypothetical protein